MAAWRVAVRTHHAGGLAAAHTEGEGSIMPRGLDRTPRTPCCPPTICAGPTRTFRITTMVTVTAVVLSRHAASAGAGGRRHAHTV